MQEYSSRTNAGLPAKIVMISAHVGRFDEVAPKEMIYGRISNIKEVQEAHHLFQMFKGLIVDMVYSFGVRRESRQYFKSVTAVDALGLIEIELNFMYEAFYTKALVLRHRFGYWFKFFSFILVLVALLFFIREDKHDFNKFDVAVTYALLCGALALDIAAFFMAIFTDYTATLSISGEGLQRASKFQKFKIGLLQRFNARILEDFLRLKRPRWKILETEPYKEFYGLSNSFLFRRWSGSISGYNLMEYCLRLPVPEVPHKINCFRIKLLVKHAFYKAIKCIGFEDAVDQWVYETEKPFLKELWEYIFDKLKKKSEDVEVEDPEILKIVCSARGELVLDKMVSNPNIREELKAFVDSNAVAFDQSLIMWHIATSLCCCYYPDNDQGRWQRQFSMILSYYMLYLLLVKPTMMSGAAGIGKIRFQVTCAEAKKFFSKRMISQANREETLMEACKLLMEVPTELKSTDVKGDRSISFLFDACRLAKELGKLENQKWETIASVWVEMLSFAASECKPTAHVKVLSEGGELISLVWLLMVQLGLSKQFQFHDTRAKLIVDE